MISTKNVIVQEGSNTHNTTKYNDDDVTKTTELVMK